MLDIKVVFLDKENKYCEKFMFWKNSFADFTWLKYSIEDNVEYFIDWKKVTDIEFYDNEYSEEISNFKDELLVFNEQDYLYIPTIKLIKDIS